MIGKRMALLVFCVLFVQQLASPGLYAGGCGQE